jgi:hypothetical protein
MCFSQWLAKKGSLSLMLPFQEVHSDLWDSRYDFSVFLSKYIILTAMNVKRIGEKIYVLGEKNQSFLKMEMDLF